MPAAPARQLVSCVVFFFASCLGFAQSSSVFTVQPAATVGVAGSYADFAFTVQIPAAQVSLGIVAFRGTANLSPRFSIVRQNFSSSITSQGSFTIGDFIVRIGNLTAADVGSYTFEITVNGQRFSDTTSQPAALTLGPPAAPTITRQPLSVLAPATMASATFTVAAIGTPSPSYQWHHNGSPINGANGPSHTVFVTTPAMGTYTVAVSNPSGTVTSAPATLAIGTPAAPSITQPPASVSTAAGHPATFSAQASGVPEPTYQWNLNGVAIPGATQSTYTVPALSPAHVGNYTVTVTNSAGSVTSPPAALNLVPPSAPAILAPPVAVAAIAGEAVSFSATVTGAPPPTFQWLKNGTAIPGATATTLTFARVEPADEGTYSVHVSNQLGSATSAGATLTILPSARLANLSVRSAVVSGQRLIVGGVVAGGGRAVLVRAIGPSLAPFGVSQMLGDPRLDLYDGASAHTYSNDDWPLALDATFTAVAAFPLTPGSKDSAFLQNLSGPFSIHTHGAGQGIVLAEMYDTGGPATARLVNLSARTHVGTGENILVAGFAIAGASTKRLLIRAVGPTLSAHGVTGALNDPQLALHGSAGVLHSNDNWDSSIANAFAQVAAFDLPAGSRDAALLVTLPPGTYTAQVSGVNNATGEALVEIYEVP